MNAGAGHPAAAVRAAGLVLAGSAGAALAAHMVPSVVSLGQWTALRALPGELCRWRGPDQAQVALTFDDGPHPDTTPLVLDRLDALDLVGTFFCLGRLVDDHPALVGEIRRRGHQVETHGYDHDHHFVRRPAWVRRDLERALATMEAVGITPGWFRPPYGQTAGATMFEAYRHRLGLVLWSAWGREWDEPDADAVARRITRDLRPGAIVLLHDTDVLNPPGSTQRVIEALGPVSAHLHATGLKAVTLDQLVQAGR